MGDKSIIIYLYFFFHRISEAGSYFNFISSKCTLHNFVLGFTKGVRLGFLILTVSLDYKNKLDTVH